MSEVKMLCPNSHTPVLDEEKSNANWKVYVDPCPECQARLEIKVA